jgi:hypothetical protein
MHKGIRVAYIYGIIFFALYQSTDFRISRQQLHPCLPLVAKTEVVGDLSGNCSLSSFATSLCAKIKTGIDTKANKIKQTAQTKDLSVHFMLHSSP